MKRLKHYPNVWQSYPFSMELFAHFEEEARLRAKEDNKKNIKKQRKPKFKLAFGW